MSAPTWDEIIDRTDEELRQKLLTRKDITDGHIDIGEIPGRLPRPGSRTAYPYDEWAKIPPGKAVEITLLLRSRHPQGVGRTLTRYFEAHNMGLHAVLRQEAGQWRMWVIRPPKEANT
jgi:hypothetical protein